MKGAFKSRRYWAERWRRRPGILPDPDPAGSCADSVLSRWLPSASVSTLSPTWSTRVSDDGGDQRLDGGSVTRANDYGFQGRMMRKVLNAVSMVWLVAAGMVVTQAARTPQGIPVDLLITRARVVDTRSGAVTPGRVIAIRGDTIVAIGDSAEGSRFRARRVVDVAGRHVIPGLWDMHMHFGGGDTLIHENRVLLPLYLADGVTAVRDAAGDLSSTVLAWRDSIARGLLDGPMIFTSGPKIEGKNSIWPGDTEVETRAGVDSALDNLQRLHVDFVKLTDNTLKPDLFRYALGEIRRRGMRSSAHIPAGVTVREAVQLGLGSIEHLSYAIRGASEGIPTAPRADNQPPSFDSANALALFRFMAERGTAITPTLNISRTLAWLDTEDHTRDDYLKYIGPGLRATYAWRIERQAGATPDVSPDGMRTTSSTARSFHYSSNRAC